MKTSRRLIVLLRLALFSTAVVVRAEDFTYITNDGTITITGYTGSGADATIPSAINGLPVTSIGNGAFAYQTAVTNVTIGASVTSIGDEAFLSCTSLADIRIPESVTNIGERAFSGCSSLTSVTIPNSVTSLGGAAFYSCEGLTNVIIGNGVRILGPAAYDPHDGPMLLDGAFGYCNNLRNVVIGNGVEIIGMAAFSGCTNLTSLTVPSSVTSIEGGPGSVYVPLEGYPSPNPWGALAFCTSLRSITIPDSVTNIGMLAFEGCTSLTNATISSGINHADWYLVFRGCTSLASFTLNAPSPSYSSINGVLFDGTQTALVQFPPGRVGDYEVPAGVTRIDAWSFFNCTKLTGITIPDSVTNVGEAAFYNCILLTNFSLGTGLLRIECSMFLNCVSLTRVTLPNSIISLGDSAFSGCSNLSSITLGSSLTSVGVSAFAGCSSLISVAIPENVKGIGTYAFLNCSNLTSIVMSDTVIGYKAFHGCTSLTGVYFRRDAPDADSSAFNDAAYPVIYYLPGTMGWGSTFAGRPTAPWLLPNPVILTTTPNFGIQDNAFGFRISWATNASVVVEGSTMLANPVWSPVSTNVLLSGWSYFSDAEWKNSPTRFYRIRSL